MSALTRRVGELNLGHVLLLAQLHAVCVAVTHGALLVSSLFDALAQDLVGDLVADCLVLAERLVAFLGRRRAVGRARREEVHAPLGHAHAKRKAGLAGASIDALQGAQEPGSRGGEPAPLSEAIVERAADEAVAEEAEEEAEEEAAEVLEEAVEVAAEVAEMEAAVWIAVAEANASVPSYSRVPPRLVWLLHPEQEPALPRTAKGSVVRRAVAARYAGWLDEELSRTSDSGSGGGGGGGDGGECGADNRSGGGAEAGAVAVGTVAQTGGAYGADSLGLAALMGRTGGGGGGRLPTSAAEVAADTLQQHIKVWPLCGVHAHGMCSACTAHALRTRCARAAHALRMHCGWTHIKDAAAARCANYSLEP